MHLFSLCLLYEYPLYAGIYPVLGVSRKPGDVFSVPHSFPVPLSLVTY